MYGFSKAKIRVKNQNIRYFYKRLRFALFSSLKEVIIYFSNLLLAQIIFL